MTPLEWQVVRVLEVFGKIAVVIDDNLDAKLITAGSFYGSTSLPDWWVCVHTLEDAELVLDAIIAWERGRDVVDQAYKLLFVDRMLPPRKTLGVAADGAGRSLRNSPIENDREIHKRFETLRVLTRSELNLVDFLGVQLLSKTERIVTVFSTSYPAAHESVGESYPWSVGAQEPLRQLRGAIARLDSGDGWRELLRFGPRPRAYHHGAPYPSGRRRAKPGAKKAERDRLHKYLGQLSALRNMPVIDADWAERVFESHVGVGTSDIAGETIQDTTGAALWHATISMLAQVIESRKSALVLLSGAGMSTSWDPVDAGIPKNDVLLADAAWWVLNQHVEETHIGLRRPRWRHSASEIKSNLLHGYGGDRRWKDVRGLVGSTNDKDLLAKTLETYIDDKHDYPRGDFNDLFQVVPGDEPVRRKASLEFRSGIRMAISEFDRGTPLQHWLAAHIDWDLIITTNYDSFHERAAMLVGNQQFKIDDAQERLSRGVRDPKQEGPRGKWGTTATRELTPRLLKVYGSALDAQNLAFTDKEFRKRVTSLPRVVSGALSDEREACFVIVGFKMADKIFANALRDTISKCVEARKLVRVRLVWVIVEAMPHYLECQKGGADNGKLAVAAWREAFAAWWASTAAERGFELDFVPLSGKALGFFHDLHVAIEEQRFARNQQRTRVPR